jgi:PAS domain S-box-containing protein
MMDEQKTKAQLIDELNSLRQQMEAQKRLAIRCRRAEEALADHMKQVDALRIVTAEIIRELNVETLLGLITQRAVDLVASATSGAIYLWAETSEEMIPQAWHGRGEWMREIHIGVGEGLVGAVAQRREGLLVNDYPNSPYVNRVFLERLGPTAIVAEPLLYRDRLVGVILISNEGTGEPFTVADHELLKVFATQAAIAIVNAQLFHRSEVQRTRSAALVNIAQQLTRGLDLQSVLSIIAEAAAQIFEGEASFRLIEGAFLVRVGATPGALKMMAKERIRIGESISGRVASSGQPHVSADVASEPDLIPEHRLSSQPDRTGASMCVPVRLGAQALGTLSVYRERGYHFDADELVVALSLADQAAIAIENARLFEQAQNQSAQLETNNVQLRREIAERQRVEDALRESEAQYRTLVEGSIQGISVVDEQGRRLFANSAYGRIFGYPNLEEVIGKPVAKNIAPHERARIDRHRRARFRGESAPIRFVYQGVHHDGTLIWLESIATMVSWAGAPAQLVALVDITERKRAEQERQKIEHQMQQAQKLESLGVLAGGIAHDFNNLLTGILTNAGMAQQALVHHHPATSYVGEVMQGARLASHLAGQLLAYAGKGRLHIRPLDLSAEVREIEPLLTTAVRGQGRLVFDLAPHLPSIEADPVQLHQVLMNLVINAAECIEEEVTIWITTSSRTLVSNDIPQLVPGHQMREGVCVVLKVEDMGCGMDEITMQRIFDPFFTSKATGRGLGLAATLGIVHGHGGGLRLTSKVGQGTSFEVYFPASDKPVDTVAEDQPGDLSGRGVILVVDDDAFVLRAASAALKSFGYRVLLAENGDRALEVFRERSREIDLIVLDMTMPGLSGEETLHRLRALHPDVKVLLSSAYDEEEVADQTATASISGFLHKPYDPEQLGSKVKQLLEGTVASLAVMMAPDPELVAVQASFRQRLPARLEALVNALREAQVTSGSDASLQAAHRITHMLKGTVGSYGFDTLATVLEELEATLKAGRDGKVPRTDMDWTRMIATLDQARSALQPDTLRDGGRPLAP